MEESQEAGIKKNQQQQTLKDLCHQKPPFPMQTEQLLSNFSKYGNI